MTLGSPEEQTSPEAREIARVKARQIREQHRRRERRARVLIISTVLVVVIAAIAVVTTSILGSVRPITPGPLNMASDGIRIADGLKAVPTGARQPGSAPVPIPVQTADAPVSIVVYTDYLCPECGEFNRTNQDQIKAWLDSGAATYEVHPLSLLDGKSQGTHFPQRAANAAGCVANYSPDDFFAFHVGLFADQPAEGSVGLTDQQLIGIAQAAGVTNLTAITDCITSLHFANWVKDATERATTGPLANADVPAVTTTPLVLVNGRSYTGPISDAPSFATFVVQAAGNSFTQTSTPTPTPTPTATATATKKPTPKPTKTK